MRRGTRKGTGKGLERDWEGGGIIVFTGQQIKSPKDLIGRENRGKDVISALKMSLKLNVSQLSGAARKQQMNNLDTLNRHVNTRASNVP